MKPASVFPARTYPSHSRAAAGTGGQNPCSSAWHHHTVLFVFIGFTSAGLPLAVTFSFLISSPLIDLASVILLASIFN